MVHFNPKIPYNGLPLLSGDRSLYYSPQVLEHLIAARAKLAELKGSTKRLPNPAMLVNTVPMQEAKDSSTIENIFTTTDALFKALVADSQEPSPSTKEVLNYRSALWTGVEEMQREGQISLQAIIEIFRQVKELERGEFRAPALTAEHYTHIQRRSNDPLEHPEVIYTPPDGGEPVKQLLENLLVFIHDDQNFDIDPLLKMAIAHYQFEAIHPFFDGNGRTGRILNMLVLLQKQLLDLPILYLSRYIVHQKDRYYQLLNHVTVTQSWEEWLCFMLKGIESTAAYTLHKIESIEQLMEQTIVQVVKQCPKMPKEVVEAVFSQPYIRGVNLVENQIYKVRSRPTANAHLGQLVKLGVLRPPEKVGREMVYINQRLIDIISDEE